jgi:curved DNA-binding protein
MLYNSTMDYYQILGVAENASQDDIKKAYKKLAMKNHPDRGGDTQKFQEISQAYDTLGDEQKRQQYNAQKNNPFIHARSGNHGFPDINDIFGATFGFGGASPFGGFQQRGRNKDLSIRVSITFKQSYTGTQIEARFNTPAGRAQTVVVDIPPGVQSGQTIRYGDLGDDSIPNLPRGNLNVTVIVEPDPVWERRGNELITVLTVTALEAMTGCMKEVACLDGSTMPLRLRPGVQHGTEFASGGRGFRDVNTGRVGSLIVVLNIIIPAVTDPQLIRELQALYAKLQ